MEEKRTEIGQLGEFGLIAHLTKDFKPQNPSTGLAVGDDAALIDAGEEWIAISTDLLCEGIHFDLRFHPLAHLGYKAVCVNVSDIAAMNAKCTQITVSLGISNRFSVAALEELYRGIHQACEDYKVDLIGGDTTSSASGLAISITAIGRVEKGKEVRRVGAKENDILCATGDLGGAYLGLQVLEREKEVFLANPEMQPELEGKSHVLQRYLRPLARTDVIHDFADKAIRPTSMIDISDGLSSEIFHLCKANNLGAAIFEDKLPVAQATIEAAAELNLPHTTAILNGGDEYELLFTLRPEDFEKVKNHPDIHTIGYMTSPDKGKVMQSTAGQVIELMAQGWTHF